MGRIPERRRWLRAEFFGYSPRAADLADPQERLFLQTTWHLLDAPATLAPGCATITLQGWGVRRAMYQHYGAFDTDVESKSLLLLNPIPDRQSGVILL